MYLEERIGLTCQMAGRDPFYKARQKPTSSYERKLAPPIGRRLPADSGDIKNIYICGPCRAVLGRPSRTLDRFTELLHAFRDTGRQNWTNQLHVLLRTFAFQREALSNSGASSLLLERPEYSTYCAGQWKLNYRGSGASVNN